jgi:hypothetical protein
MTFAARHRFVYYWVDGMLVMHFIFRPVFPAYVA